MMINMSRFTQHRVLYEALGKPLPQELKRLQQHVMKAGTPEDKVNLAEMSGLLMPKALRPPTVLPKNNIEEVKQRLMHIIHLNGQKVNNLQTSLLSGIPHLSSFVYRHGRIIGLRPKPPQPDIAIKDETHLLNSSPAFDKAFAAAKKQSGLHNLKG